jgi:hypothetical protein
MAHPRIHPRTPQGHIKSVLTLQVSMFLRGSDERLDTLHVGPRLGSPTPCTRGTRVFAYK